MTLPYGPPYNPGVPVSNAELFGSDAFPKHRDRDASKKVLGSDTVTFTVTVSKELYGRALAAAPDAISLGIGKEGFKALVEQAFRTQIAHTLCSMNREELKAVYRRRREMLVSAVDESNWVLVKERIVELEQIEKQLFDQSESKKVSDSPIPVGELNTARRYLADFELTSRGNDEELNKLLSDLERKDEVRFDVLLRQRRAADSQIHAYFKAFLEKISK